MVWGLPPFTDQQGGAHSGRDSREQIGRRVPLCAGPGAGLTVAPGERSLWRHFGARNQNPDFPSSFLHFLRPPSTPHLGT